LELKERTMCPLKILQNGASSQGDFKVPVLMSQTQVDGGDLRDNTACL
jgi:hypothetical protein